MSSSSPRELPGDARAARLSDPIPAIGEREKAGRDASADDAARSAGPRQEQRRERQRQEARRTILDAAEALVIENNGSDFSIRALGERSGYSAPTVYHYFGDKEGLIEALLEERVSRLAEELERVDPTGDSRADLRAMLLAYFHFSADNPNVTRLMSTLSRKGESREPEAMQRVKDRIGGAVDRFGESGRLGVFDRDSAGRILWALAYGLVSLRVSQPDFILDDRFVERALDALFLGMAEMENPS
ncbi:MAG: TetR/AcrR family transcriptional regulator [Myxococcota bacterium]